MMEILCSHIMAYLYKSILDFVSNKQIIIKKVVQNQYQIRALIMEDRIEFAFINWQDYFSVFQTKQIKNLTKEKGGQGFFLFMQAYILEFRDKKYKQALEKYKLAQEQNQPFSTYRLAQIYLKENNFGLMTNFELSWYYLIKSTTVNAVIYQKDLFNGKQKLGLYIEKLDPQLINCKRLIEKYENKKYSKILCFLFLLQFSSSYEQNQIRYKDLMEQISNVLKKEQEIHIFQLLLSLITARLELKHKPMNIIVEIIFKNTQLLANYLQRFLMQLNLVITYEYDNIIFSKIRDQVIEFIYIKKLLKFAYKSGDKNIMSFNNNLLKVLKVLFDNLVKVKVLQDRIFIIYYLCEIIYEKDKNDAQTYKLIKQLQTLIDLKPHINSQGFFYYLKYKIQKNLSDLQKSLQIYENELQTDRNNQMIINYYLSKISTKLKNPQSAFQHLKNGYKIYSQKHHQWNELTLQSLCYFKKIKQKLKRKKEIQIQIESFRTEYFIATNKNKMQSIEKSNIIKKFLIQQIELTRFVKKQKNGLFFQAVVDQSLAMVQKIPFINKQEFQKIISDIEFKFKIIHQNICPIVGYAFEMWTQQNKNYYYNIYLVYKSCYLHIATTFQEKIFQLWKMIKAYNYISYRTNKSNIIAVFNMKLNIQIIGWIQGGPQQQKKQELYENVVEEYKLDFLKSKLKNMSYENIQFFFQELFYSI